MAHDPTPHYLDPKYDKFLQSSVGDDRRGAGITVLSMLARLGVDPWREASELASMPEGRAHQRLDALMARFTGVPSWVPSRNDVVSRLLVFLPRRSLSGKSIMADPSSKSLLNFFGTPLYIAFWIAPLVAYYVYRAFGN